MSRRRTVQFHADAEHSRPAGFPGFVEWREDLSHRRLDFFATSWSGNSSVAKILLEDLLVSKSAEGHGSRESAHVCGQFSQAAITLARDF